MEVFSGLFCHDCQGNLWEVLPGDTVIWKGAEMNFEELDEKMRRFEQSLDQIIWPETYLVARADGRNFTKLTKEICQFEAPFDTRFRDAMVDTTKHLMECGFRIIYGYTESDEISLLFHPDDNTFGRKTRKINSVLAGEASACMSLQLGVPACFDCRVVPLPNLECVGDYFAWRQEDAHRNSLNAHCYWMLRKKGISPRQATKELEAKSISWKNELLFSENINFNDLPSWQKRGIGLYYTVYEKEGYNPVSGQTVTGTRNRITADMELKTGEAYRQWVLDFL